VGEPPQPADRFDDEHYPAYSMGAAAELLGVTPAFLRGLGEAGLITPHRSGGRHRRYSRHQLSLANRARQLVDEGMTMAAACRVVGLEDEVSGLRGQVDRLREEVGRLEDRLSTANRLIGRLRREPGDGA
jgi:DNA-binding transcriptional MerR regulator